MFNLGSKIDTGTGKLMLKLDTSTLSSLDSRNLAERYYCLFGHQSTLLTLIFFPLLARPRLNNFR